MTTVTYTVRPDQLAATRREILNRGGRIVSSCMTGNGGYIVRATVPAPAASNVDAVRAVLDMYPDTRTSVDLRDYAADPAAVAVRERFRRVSASLASRRAVGGAA